MKKIISLFMRNYDGDHLVRDEVVPGAEWVVNGEGIATRKWDGTACMVRDGKLYKRYDAKRGKTPPAGFEPAQEPDPKTGHWPGWLPVGGGPEDKWFREVSLVEVGNGTYELVGPKIGGNPERFEEHTLVAHGFMEMNAPRTFNALREYFEYTAVEGIVWHHPDGRMVKIKARDFGLSWPRKDTP
jgi:hypothetical protein